MCVMVKNFDQHLHIGSLDSTCGVKALNGLTNRVGGHPPGRQGSKFKIHTAWRDFISTDWDTNQFFCLLYIRIFCIKPSFLVL